jgi:hypothetical protein
MVTVIMYSLLLLLLLVRNTNYSLVDVVVKAGVNYILKVTKLCYC